MKKIIILLVFDLLQNLSAQNQAPVVTNVNFSQRPDSSFIVDVYYDISDSDNALVTITIKASSNEGQTWDFSAESVSGDVGDGITIGAGKHIVWNFGDEHPQFYSDRIKIKIIADDHVVDCGTVDYAGKIYNTIIIGTQCWMRENLDVGEMIVSNSVSDNQTDNGIIEKYCYDNDPGNCITYGGLYQWNEAMAYDTTEGAQGICPDGWHIPTRSNFLDLKDIVGGSGNALKAVGQGIGKGAGTNTSGFSGLLAGGRYGTTGGYGTLTQVAHFWSSTSVGDNLFLNIGFADDNAIFYFFDHSKNFGFSVRCVKD